MPKTSVKDNVLYAAVAMNMLHEQMEANGGDDFVIETSALLDYVRGLTDLIAGLCALPRIDK